MDQVADDARLSFVNTPTIEGREALGAYLGRLFASYDMSTHRASYADVEIHGHLPTPSASTPWSIARTMAARRGSRAGSSTSSAARTAARGGSVASSTSIRDHRTRSRDDAGRRTARVRGRGARDRPAPHRRDPRRAARDDAAHEYRARAFLALGRLPEAEEHAQAAVRLDPDEIRYGGLLAQVLSAEGAPRCRGRVGRLARNDPRETAWTIARRPRSGSERSQPGMGVDTGSPGSAAGAGRRPRPAGAGAGPGPTGDARGVSRAQPRPGCFPTTRLAARPRPMPLARRRRTAPRSTSTPRWPAGFAAPDRERVARKARTLHRRPRLARGRALAAIGPAFDLALRNGWVRDPR